TLTLALACAFGAGLVFVPQRRRRLLAALPPVAASSGVAAILTAPFVYYLLTDFQTRAFHPPQDFVADLLNFVVPTKLALAAHGWAGPISSRFPGNDSERGAYLGVPALVIAGLYAWNRLRTPGGRFLVASLLLAVLAALGAPLTVDAHRVAPLPWEHVGYLQLL